MSKRLVAVISAVAGVLVGFAAAYGMAQRTVRQMLYAGEVRTIVQAESTLRFSGPERMDKVVRYHELMLRTSAADTAHFRAPIPREMGRSTRVQQSLQRAQEYAETKGWDDTVAHLQRIRGELSSVR